MFSCSFRKACVYDTRTLFTLLRDPNCTVLPATTLSLFPFSQSTSVHTMGSMYLAWGMWCILGVRYVVYPGRGVCGVCLGVGCVVSPGRGVCGVCLGVGYVVSPGRGVCGVCLGVGCVVSPGSGVCGGSWAWGMCCLPGCGVCGGCLGVGLWYLLPKASWLTSANMLNFRRVKLTIFPPA
jgi:hypothetical protein